MERDGLEYLGVDGGGGRNIKKKKQDARSWTGLIWLRIGTGGGLL
jgi:hypothetical protein